ncbi:MAG: type II toxin-antitoxin system RelE/ParE family toxin [Phycisphaerales bacterium]|nr:type II toxin-antitoxin system RelE/ParE family toxin [Phycisphaerales bacterium]
MIRRIELGRRAERELSDLPDAVMRRIVDKLRQLAENPFPRGVKKLEGGGYRIRIGDYRVLYDVRSADRTVVISAIGHRRDVYRH